MIIIPTDAMFFLKTLTIAALLYVLTNILIRSLLSKTRHPLPPGPRGFPVVGALPLLGNMPHVALAKMAKKYGPIIYLKVGTYGMIVASTPESAKAFLKTLDTNFVNRPPNAGAKHVAYNSQDMVFGKYGARWRLLRKLSNLHMLGNKALGDWREIRVSEVGYMLDGMHEASCKRETVVLSEMLVFAISNMIGQVMFSRRIFVTRGEELNEFKDMVVELLTSAGHFNIGDFIPSIAWMDLQGIEKGMKHLHKKFDDLISKILDEHLRSTHTRIEKPDFLDVVLANRDTLDGERLSTNNVKALILNMFVAATDTTSSTIEWAIAEMMINPIILKRAQSEMDQIVGRNRRLMESDIPKLPYLQAICKEAFRKHPSTPLNLPRVALEPCTVDGYYIPKNTRLSVNIWAIGRDPNVWENPLEFNPDRFMSGKNAKLDPTGHDFELIPFGSGRRICAGARMGVVLVEYLLGSLIHSFDWTLPEGVVEMNMDETFGMALQKTVPLAAMVTPRLPLNCYGP